MPQPRREALPREGRGVTVENGEIVIDIRAAMAPWCDVCDWAWPDCNCPEPEVPAWVRP